MIDILLSVLLKIDHLVLLTIVIVFVPVVLVRNGAIGVTKIGTLKLGVISVCFLDHIFIIRWRLYGPFTKWFVGFNHY